MMANLVVVATPATDDDVWQVSSEKIPHMTICFLGSADTNPNINSIADYVKAQAARLAPFNLRVDHRGILGSDEADVLFFSEDIPWPVHDFRDRLLSDVNIKSAYNSVPQHNRWKPHLTLGYPDTPANKDDWDSNEAQYVKFDKIGVWFSDFGGFSIPLTDNSPKISSIRESDGAWSALVHYGKKGMRWGVRNKSSSSAPTRRGDLARVGVSGALAPILAPKSFNREVQLRKEKATTKKSPKVSVSQKGKKLKTTGGAGRKATPEAVKVAELRQVRKKSGVHALSNEELQAYSKRLNLEQKVSNLERDQPGIKNWISRTLKGQGNQSVNQVGQSVRTKAAKGAIKKVGVAAVA